MSRLTEKHVQKKAILYLERHYQKKYEPATIYARREVRTIKKFKAKRADGLLCFDSSIKKEHTISLEAKSHKTLGSLVPYWNDNDLILYGMSGLFFALFSLYFFIHLEWYWITIISISGFVGGFLLLIVIFVLIEPDHFKSMAVMDQIEQYPANEKWIAFSKDSFNLLLNKTSELQRRSNHENILRIARKKGVGILVISRMREEIFVSPSFNKGEYLDCYCRATIIRKEIYSQGGIL